MDLTEGRGLVKGFTGEAGVTTLLGILIREDGNCSFDAAHF